MSVLVFGAIIISIATYLYFTKTSECKKWLKFASAYLYLRWFNRKPPLFPFDVHSKDLKLLGVVPMPKATLMENPRPLNPHKHAIDKIRISGVNKEGDTVSIYVARRHNRQSEVSIYLRLKDGEEYQLPLHPDTTVYNTDGRTFSASGLTMEVLEALRRWKISFNGFLRRINCKAGEDELVLVKFNFLWKPLLNYVSFPEDYDPVYVANHLSEHDEYSAFQFNNLTPNEHYEQFGQLRGTINISGAKENRNLILRGLKHRTHGHEQLDNIQQRMSIEGVLHNGSSFHIFAENVTNGLVKFFCGYVIPPCNMTVHHINQCHINVDQFCDNTFQPPDKLYLNFVAGGANYKLILNTHSPYKYQYYSGESRDILTSTYTADVTLNSRPGNAIIRFSRSNLQKERHSPTTKSETLLIQPDIPSTDKLVVRFGEAECDTGQLVGGKGSSLSLMNSLVQPQSNFKVPGGLCLTKTAFDLHLKQNPIVAKAIANLITLAGTAGTPAQLEGDCEKLMELIEHTTVSSQLGEKLNTTMISVAGENYAEKRFAVRSSAVGEDGDDLSSAGQNETFLGVKGLKQICTSVVKCWASQFAFRAIEYLRQNGQLINKGMAVVVQEMCEADVAGVLFSRDPVTGSPDKMFITSNFGLGETVVSAAVDPDTIIIGRSWDDKLSVQRVQIGTKGVRMNMTADGGVEEVEVDPSVSMISSIPEDIALQLGEIALYLEKCFGGSRDIEWAISKGQIYLLQSRPVTTDNPTTDEEIIHEYDTGSITDYESYSTANVAEVFPGAFTPINYNLFVRGNVPLCHKMFHWKLEMYKYDPTLNEGWIDTYCGRIFFNMIVQKVWSIEKEKGRISKAMEVGLYGRVLDDKDINDAALERYEISASTWHKIKTAAIFLKGMLISNWMLNKAAVAHDKYTVPTEGINNPLKCHEALSKAFARTCVHMGVHASVTFGSTLWSLLTLSVLANSNEDFTTDQYGDFAVLLGTCTGAESGNVPASLEELATVVAKETDPKQFSKMPTEEALKWLQRSGTRANSKFKEFIEKHGHRGFKEFDVSSTTWGMEPMQLVKAIQGMLQVGTPKEKVKPNADEVLAQIKTQLTPFRKFLLKQIMRGCRNGVCYRERAKSMLIKTQHFMRLGYRQLSQLMVQQGYFIDPNLIFFFSHDEIEILIHTRSPRLLKRAKHRQRMHRIMDEYKFQEITNGEPVPINMLNENIQVVLSGVKIKGFPVSQGTVKAPARVLSSVKEVHTIQAGEILITYGTDIGWTPYFPLLAGVVTELGGLVSHGAVIARECGLPCIVGVKNASKLFQTGDIVYLNATEGFITKVEAN